MQDNRRNAGCWLPFKQRRVLGRRAKTRARNERLRKIMWDVLVTVILMGFGALMVIVMGAIFIAAIFYMQNGGRNE